ncbi:isoprenylcysteine carboxyl methyltransferase family protein [Bacillus spizizenii]|uniref:isoprenylcysteine carboxyl methyltransferase family protein n=1 Tax=Bacillus spizizenii TaxID=96241 RepID=UPI0005C99C6B|nr:isoprenylcysteine carboxyl methyltransferase family protein [Bacillus spizizenii]MDU7577246.1 isoprenylcysteine carboxyl methyltransferase family protein [Bacillus subtilis]MCY7762205.1 isoprenylcysteine carboxyl methyltransferase family protein [Bacillus spizizenii]MCY7797355.1 isoprenylcysteine carboxyl methyltransferase family protein [Bacillus spizizenii]MCY7803838.1 isoprenylcysteine carboxyl methyltransferase family protein [Bacillus spizizenii]MCY7807556.1 isoprenylcysteine carboxyl 
MFWLLIAILIAQRAAEMAVARQNEQKVKKQGAIEFGESHYPYIISMHILFFLSLIAEVLLMNKQPSSWWIGIAAAILIVQAVRYWALCSLGAYWNTKILVVPGAELVKKGPYKWMKHPNYTVVILEILLIPLLYQAYVTMCLFSIVNAVLLTVRIRTEDKALEEYSIK